jgi:predicted adenylyl cyclase CyaB
MTETELKAVVENLAHCRSLVERAGGVLEMEGHLQDQRYEDEAGRMRREDHVLRVRIFRGGGRSEASLEWKGPTRLVHGLKAREEIGTKVADAAALTEIIERLGYEVTRTIDREIAQYTLHGATVRFERYPRMDDLVEVEGTADAIERAIAALELPRESFTADSLPAFMTRYQQRTGKRPVVCAADLDGGEW